MPKLSKESNGGGGKTAPQRPVIYDNIEVNGVSIAPESMVITCETMKALIGWETEPDYKLRRSKEAGWHLDSAGNLFDPAGQPHEADWLLTDENDEKVICSHNGHNRELSERTARAYAQDILTKNWAGPSAMPGETVNGETIIVSRTGEVISGQHRAVGLILACQIWAKQKNKHVKTWPQEPVMDSLIVFGVSDSPRIVRTLDNVKTRSLADTIFTSDDFKDMDLDRRMRGEISRMLDAAIDFLWKRTEAHDTWGKGAVKGENGYKTAQTHSASLTFRDRHKRIDKAVRHLFDLNKGRAISLLHLSAGQSAAMLYLMGSGESDIDEYRNGNPPTEKHLDWSSWDKACQFWTDLAESRRGDNGKAEGPLKALVQALYELVRDRDGPAAEKTALVIKAWHAYREGVVEQDDLELEYAQSPDGSKRLIDGGDFGGIDCGDKEKLDPDIQHSEVLERIKKEDARRAAAQKAVDVITDRRNAAKQPAKPASVGLAAEIEAIRNKHPGKVLVFSTATGSTLYGQDAKIAAKLTGGKVAKSTVQGMEMVKLTVSQKNLDNLLLSVSAKHPVVTIARNGDEQWKATEYRRKDGKPLAPPVISNPSGKTKSRTAPKPSSGGGG